VPKRRGRSTSSTTSKPVASAVIDRNSLLAMARAGLDAEQTIKMTRHMRSIWNEVVLQVQQE
jgi:hypothetical protein